MGRGRELAEVPQGPVYRWRTDVYRCGDVEEETGITVHVQAYTDKANASPYQAGTCVWPGDERLGVFRTRLEAMAAADEFAERMAERFPNAGYEREWSGE